MQQHDESHAAPIIAATPGPVEMRAYLKRGGNVLSEMWMYQYHPFEFIA